MSALLAQDSGAHVGACYGQVCEVTVIVIGGKVCQDMFPATVVVDWARRINGSIAMVSSL